MFDTLTALNPYKDGNSATSLIARFGCAQVTAIVAGYASYPFDTVRRRLQMQSEKPVEQWTYKGTLDCFAKVAAKEGSTAFFKGAGANALRTVGSALVLVFYESARQALGIRKSTMGGGG
jgi:solute carrier family 25 (adenine nucleotide translocator) protein 4/5/6/31